VCVLLLLCFSLWLYCVVLVLVWPVAGMVPHCPMQCLAIKLYIVVGMGRLASYWVNGLELDGLLLRWHCCREEFPRNLIQSWQRIFLELALNMSMMEIILGGGGAPRCKTPS
jgi:hypothetical protein